MTKIAAHKASSDVFRKIESIISDGITNESQNEARSTLRNWLKSQDEAIEKGSTIAQCISQLAKDAHRHSLAASIIVRCLDIDDLLPASGRKNDAARHIVHLCEAALPDLCDFMKLNNKKMNHEKLQILSQSHYKIYDILSLFRSNLPSFDMILGLEKDIMGKLNHAAVRAYCGPLGLEDARNTIDCLIRHIRLVANPSQSFLSDVAALRQVISDAQACCADLGSFLGRDIITPFVASVEAATEEFLNSVQGRFRTKITAPGGELTVLTKRYPLHRVGNTLRLLFPLRNDGPGTAVNLSINIDANRDETDIGTEHLFLGNVAAGDFSFDIEIAPKIPMTMIEFLIEVEWNEIDSTEKRNALITIQALAQRTDINWSEREFWCPYNLREAEGDQFIGRSEKVRELASKLLRSSMEPFYITGQKRVGKTSLAKAVASLAHAKSRDCSLEYHYLLWGRIQNDNPRVELQRLGENIEKFLLQFIPENLRPGRKIYDGTLSPLLDIADILTELESTKKFVILIDEFDEINQDLYLQGKLAESVFGSIRSIATTKNICLILIGGENMAFVIDRQSQKLNKYSICDLDYFSRSDEWEDFKLLVRKPSDSVINWHEDAINEIYYMTNGNPYYTNMICSKILNVAIKEKDADITAVEVRRVIKNQLVNFAPTSFSHFWQDGIFRALDDREPEILRRKHVLIAIARCIRLNHRTLLASITRNKSSSFVKDDEVLPILQDFVRRGVLEEIDGEYRFVLILFRDWLVEVGFNSIFSDTLTEQLAEVAQKREDDAYVTSRELVAVVENWSTYRGKTIGVDDIKAWYEQVDSQQEQRLLFKIAQNLRFYSEAEIREKIRTIHLSIKNDLPIFNQKNRASVRRDVILTYVDGEGKSGQQFSALYAEENKITSQNVCHQQRFVETLKTLDKQKRNLSGVIIVDDIVATGNSLSGNVKKFIEQHHDIFKEWPEVRVFVVAITSTKEGEERLRETVTEYNDVQIDVRVGELINDSHYAFPKTGYGIWADNEEFEQAESLCRNLGGNIYPDNPLGYGEIGLLVVLPTTCPNNSLPILHSRARAPSKKSWNPLFLREVN